MHRRIFRLILPATLVLLAGCSQVILTFSPPPPSLHAKEPDQKCYRNGKMSKKQRRTIYPFNTAYRVRIISFNTYITDLPVSNRYLVDSLLIDNIVLTEEQTDGLTDILYNYNYSKKTVITSQTSYGCYEPKHAIIFINEKEEIFAYLQVDTRCRHIITGLTEKSTGVFCENKFDLLEAFFRSVGITHYEEKMPEITPQLKDATARTVKKTDGYNNPPS